MSIQKYLFQYKKAVFKRYKHIRSVLRPSGRRESFKMADRGCMTLMKINSSRCCFVASGENLAGLVNYLLYIFRKYTTSVALSGFYKTRNNYFAFTLYISMYCATHAAVCRTHVVHKMQQSNILIFIKVMPPRSASGGVNVKPHSVKRFFGFALMF